MSLLFNESRDLSPLLIVLPFLLMFESKKKSSRLQPFSLWLRFSGQLFLRKMTRLLGNGEESGSRFALIDFHPDSL